MRQGAWPGLLLGLLAGCPAQPPGTQVSMSFARSRFYDAPFPSDDLRRPDGTLALGGAPNRNHVELFDKTVALLSRDARGFSLAGAVFFRAEGPLDTATLPDLGTSVTDGASVFLAGVDETGDDFLRRRPAHVAFELDPGPFGEKNLLSVLPLQGVPLAAGRRYAAVVTRAVRDAEGRALSLSPTMLQLSRGQRPEGLTDEAYQAYREALAALAPLVRAEEVAALAVFTTDSPAARLAQLTEEAAAQHPATFGVWPAAPAEVFTDYCVFESTVEVPVYQSGVTPYSSEGGDWRPGADGHVALDHLETARLVFTVPRAPTPAAGWPTVLFVRAGGGGDRPLVDRGACATHEFTQPLVPGSGPARELAQVGFAGVQFDGPLGGGRNTTGGDEQYLVSNVFNPGALRDNVRQAALELRLVARALSSLSFDASSCPGAGVVRVDGAHLALMGHSTGAWIAQATAADEPSLRALVLSGAGGSYLANAMDKQKPSAVRPLAELLLGYTAQGRSLVPHDPVLTFMQWAAEPSDPQAYAPRVARATPPRHVLMLQGIVDHYILPTIANTTSLALELDLAGPAYDEADAELRALGQPPLAPLLVFSGRSRLSLPAQGNAAEGAKTAVVVQHLGDAVEDGHEVVFQTEPPKHQYRCFLASFLDGVPRVPASDSTGAPCP